MSECPTGREALSTIRQYNVPVELGSGPGSYFTGNKIVLSRQLSVEDSALTLIHEAHHASEAYGNTTGDVLRQPRGEFVTTMVNEEAVGAALEIQAKRELAEAGRYLTATVPGEQQFLEAADRGVKRALQDEQGFTSEAALQGVARKSGTDELNDMLWAGDLVASTNREMYPMNYGIFHMRMHRARVVPQEP